MKKIILFSALVFALCGCKERTNLINFKDTDQLYIDSTYTGAVPPAQNKGVLLEDLTGVQCANCPAAQLTARNIRGKYPKGRVVLVSMHPASMGTLVKPYDSSKYDFRSTQTANLLKNYLGGDPLQLPLGMVDRRGSNPQLPSYSWSTKVDSQILKTTPVNIDSNKIDYNENSKELKASFIISFTEDVTPETFVTVALTQSNMIDWQDSSAKIIRKYVHRDVLRKYMEPYYGLSLGKANTKGRHYRISFTTLLKDENIPEDCQLVVIVHKLSKGDTEVFHAREFEIK